ncbi:unnamed protein product [Clavelina lepadiformis]|uniref:Uncharacterized protein n=1 Tax=Clavelina lepadiformis TaxID=159417 RepID=A0ABP0FMJ1_CLALP
MYARFQSDVSNIDINVLFMQSDGGLTLIDQYFPKLFGPDENQCLDVDATRKLFEKLRDEIIHFNSFEIPGCDLLTLEEVDMILRHTVSLWYGPGCCYSRSTKTNRISLQQRYHSNTRCHH